MAEMNDLIARLEAACEGNSLFDIDIARVLGWTCLAEHQDNDHCRMIVLQAHETGDWSGLNWDDAYKQPKGDCRRWPFTTSLDAALTLVPEGYVWGCGFSVHVRHEAWVSSRATAHGQWVGEHDHSRALALCIAALKARRG